MSLKILHNPRCSKSRQTLALLEEKGLKPEVIEYLQTPPSESFLGEVVQKLGVEPEAIVRKKEDLFAELGLKDRELTKEEWVEWSKLLNQIGAIGYDSAEEDPLYTQFLEKIQEMRTTQKGKTRGGDPDEIVNSALDSILNFRND